MQFVAAKAKIWWNNKGSSFFCNTVCTVSQKSPTFDLLWSSHTPFDCNNFWQECCRESRQSKLTLFSHLT